MTLRPDSVDVGKLTFPMPMEKKKMDKPIRILFLASNPRDTTQKRLGEEMRAIDQAIRQADFRDKFDIQQQWAVRISDLQSHLLRYKPEIVHFSGNGSASREIVLKNNRGNSQAVPIPALSKLFALLKDNIRCVVLNACYSAAQAQAIAQHIDCVIGMSKAIGDTAAIRFVAAFYQALGYGRDVRTAFDLGCLQISLDNLGEEDTPKLLAISSNPKKLVLVTDTNLVKVDSSYEPLAKEYDVIPSRPDSIAIGLQTNLIEFANALKFQLLFFDKPHAILSTPGMDYIDEEAVHAARTGKPYRTSVWEDEENLVGKEILATDEWLELMSHCEQWGGGFNLVTDDSEEETRDSDIDAFLEHLNIKDPLGYKRGADEGKDEDDITPEEEDEIKMQIGYAALRWQVIRLTRVLKHCYEKRISMMWGDEIDVRVSRMYVSSLLQQYDSSEDECLLADIRRLHGSRLLKRIRGWNILNLASVPVVQIVKFRKANHDLLDNFLSLYRGFLLEIEENPNQKRLNLVANQWDRRLHEELKNLNHELLSLRRPEKFEWLKKAQEGQYESSKRGRLSSIWSFFGTPGLISALSAGYSNLTGSTRSIQQRNKLIRQSSMGYLWKAKEELRRET
jgi:hypothetical protein